LLRWRAGVLVERGLALCSRVVRPDDRRVAFLLGGSAPDAGLAGGQGVGQARRAYRTAEAHGLGGEDLRERRVGRGDGEEKLGIFTPAGTARHPARGDDGQL
jgi:hypothetical protein